MPDETTSEPAVKKPPPKKVKAVKATKPHKPAKPLKVKIKLVETRKNGHAPKKKINDKKAHGTAADFIRKFPNSKADEIIDKARVYGMKLSRQHVYTTRAQDKARERRKNGDGDTALINHALITSAAANMNTDRLLREAGDRVRAILHDTHVTSFSIDLRTKKISCTVETIEEMTL